MTGSTVRTFRREKIIILAAWFAGLIGVRVLMASLLALEGTWVATIGSVGIIFAIFYVALKYTPLSKYAQTVNSALLSWFSKRYILAGAVSSMVVLSSLIFFAEFGYFYYSDALVRFEQFRHVSDSDNSFESVQRLFASPPENVLAGSREQYGIVGTMSILVASVDKSLGGYYVKAVSFILAEDIEVLIFIILIRRSAGRGLFQSGKGKLQERKLNEYNNRT
jgi:hypothetical protein